MYLWKVYCFGILMLLCLASPVDSQAANNRQGLRQCKHVRIPAGENNGPNSALIRDSNDEPVDIVSVEVSSQESIVPCKALENFFYTHPGSTVVVKKGCAATFLVCFRSYPLPPPGPYPEPLECTTVRLLSRTASPEEKVITSSFGGNYLVSMTLLTQLPDSAADCIDGKTFLHRGLTVIARLGCRGEFRVCIDPSIAILTTASALTCEIYTLLSRVNAPETKTIPRYNGGIVSMNVYEEYSNNLCVSGSTFGFNRIHGTTIYANGGCRASFEVCQCPINPFP